jgi:hypothetical protein
VGKPKQNTVTMERVAASLNQYKEDVLVLLYETMKKKIADELLETNRGFIECCHKREIWPSYVVEGSFDRLRKLNQGD